MQRRNENDRRGAKRRGAPWRQCTKRALARHNCQEFASVDNYALFSVLTDQKESRGIIVKYPPEEAICGHGHMFSCGGSIFDYEKKRGGRERERTRDDDEEDRTSTHQGKVSIYLIYIMCILF